MVNSLWENLFRKEDRQNELLHLLKNNYLFEELTRKELQFLESMVHIRNYLPGEPVFKQREIGIGMYIVAKGSVDIFVDETGSKSDNNSLFITRLSPGDFFGEVSLVEENGRRTATAIACDDLQLVGFFKTDLNEIIERSPQMGVKILLRLSEVLGKRLKETADKISDLKKELKGLVSQGEPEVKG